MKKASEKNLREQQMKRRSSVKVHLLDSQIELLKKKNKYVSSNSASINMEESSIIHVIESLPWLPVFNEKEGKYEIKRIRQNAKEALLSTGYKVRWVGGIDKEVPAEHQEAVRQELKQFNCFPVFLTNEEIKLGFHGFANQVIWPMMHYEDSQFIDAYAQYKDRDETRWKAYQKVNEKIVQEVNALLNMLNETEKGSNNLVWVHDYQLMLVPQLLRKDSPELKIGFFFHLPFPSTEIFKMSPYRNELLHGLLSSNLIGFNGYDYVRHFSNSCLQLLGLESSIEGVDALRIGGCLCKLGAFPIGIDVQQFEMLLDDLDVQDQITELKETLGNRKIILGVDKLGKTKGILQKLAAYELFLKNNKELRDKVILVQIISEGILGSDDAQLRSEIYETISKINGLYGTFGKMPIQQINGGMPFESLVPLYAAADFLFITSLRDGMNIVPYEYVACQQKNHGVLILSEFAGSAFCVGAGSLIVNPWDVRKTASVLQDALNIEARERKARHMVNFEYISNHTSHDWATSFIQDLEKSFLEMKGLRSSIPDKLNVDSVLQSFRERKKKLIVVTLLNVLTQKYKNNRDYQFHDLIKLQPGVKDALKKLSAREDTTVVLISRCERKILDKIFADLPIWLISDNGYYFKKGTETEWSKLVENVDLSWKKEVSEVMKIYCDLTPGSFISGNTPDSVGISWNFPDSHPQSASAGFHSNQINDLLVHLWAEPLSNTAAEVLTGLTYLEVRPPKVAPVYALEKLMTNHAGGIKDYDFILCVGQFLSKDEDIYNYLHTKGASLSTEEHKTIEETIEEKLKKLELHNAKLESLYNLDDANAQPKEGKLHEHKVSTFKKHDTDIFLCNVSREFSLANFFIENSSGLVIKLAEQQ